MIDLVIIGNLTADPKERTVNTSNGQKTVADFTVAVNSRRQNEDATFIRVSAWDKLGENCAKWLIKGRKVAVRADNITARTYTRADGTAAASLEVTARDVEFLSRGEDKTEQEKPAMNTTANKYQQVEVDANDLPF
jgi:single-strand DNA-binding protein